jgi:hypothetical protein
MSIQDSDSDAYSLPQKPQKEELHIGDTKDNVDRREMTEKEIEEERFQRIQASME